MDLGDDNMTPFRAQLEQAVNARCSRMNPLTEREVNGELRGRSSARGAGSTTSTWRSSRAGAR